VSDSRVTYEPRPGGAWVCTAEGASHLGATVRVLVDGWWGGGMSCDNPDHLSNVEEQALRRLRRSGEAG
jgi:hypothetical protein